MSRKPFIYPQKNFLKNLKEVTRLLEIHTEQSGKGPGYKYNVEVLNKSAIVLLVACWESFVEDLAESTFSLLLSRAKSPSIFPNRVLALAVKSLKEDKNDTAVWQLAGLGWKEVLKAHKDFVFNKCTGSLNTPRAQKVDEIYESLIGLKGLSASWGWKKMSSKSSVEKLDELVTLRCEIAHRVVASTKVKKSDVRSYVDFVNRIAVKTSNEVRKIIIERTKKDCWPEFSYRSKH